MQDLINQLKEKFDLPDEKAGEILETVVGSIREKLPEPIASKLDGLLDGEGFDLAELAGSLTGMAEGLKGDIADKIPDELGDLGEKASGLLGGLFKK